MSVASEDEANNIGHLSPDPLLKTGGFIDPIMPTSSGTNYSYSYTPQTPSNLPETPDPSQRASSEDTSCLTKPDWLPPGWKFLQKVRSSGASAGTRDKYYLDPVTNRQFRSKKEVLYYLETGSVKKKKNNAKPEVENILLQAQTNSQTPKRKKTEARAKELAKYFDFDDIPDKVKWELTDIYEGTWRPLINGVNRVPESSKQEWSAAFTYLTLQTGGRGSF